MRKIYNMHFFFNDTMYIHCVPLILGQTSRGGWGHEDKHYSLGNRGGQTSFVGARGR